MSNSVPLKYGWVSGGKSSFPLPMKASEKFADKGGKFVDSDSGYGAAVDSSSTVILGWVETAGAVRSGNTTPAAYFTCEATSGLTVLNCIHDLTAVFRMPIAYAATTYTVNWYDIYYDTTIYAQFADLTNSSDDFIILVGGLACSATFDYAVTTGDGYVLVMQNPEKSGGV